MPQLTKAQAKKMGIPKKTLQTIEIPRETFTLAQGRAWLKKHNYANAYYRNTPNFKRYMQTPDIKGATYYSKKIDNGIIFVYQEY